MSIDFQAPIEGAPHFTLAELCHSSSAKRKGIDNTPGETEIENLLYLARTVLEPVRMAMGQPIVVTSGYRSPAVNRLVGGSSTSHHRTGCAADIRFERASARADSDIFCWIAENLPYTELIAEGIPEGWIHAALVKGKEGEKAIKYMLDSEGIVRRSDYATVTELYRKYEG